MMSQDRGLDEFVRQYKASTPETLVGVFSDFADVYDKIINEFQNDGHKLTTDAVQRVITCKSLRILDFASGTGQLGEKMYAFGYTNLDSFDGSASSTEEARKKNIYTNMIVEFVGENNISIEDDVYDAIVCYGGFARNHLPLSVLSDWIRCVKPGGYIINSFRRKWLTEDPRYNEGKLQGEIKRLEDEGRWKLISNDVLENTDPERVVLNYVHQVVQLD